MKIGGIAQELRPADISLSGVEASRGKPNRQKQKIMKQVAVFLALRSFRAKLFRHGLCLALLLFLSGRLPAEISLGQARHAAGTCDGAVPVIANGTAGPFELRVVGDNGYDELFGEFTDTLLVENLCPGNYDFLIANRFLCEVVLSTTVYTCPTLLSTVTQPSCGQFNGRILGKYYLSN
jgi:hypothetical protein